MLAALLLKGYWIQSLTNLQPHFFLSTIILFIYEHTETFKCYCFSLNHVDLMIRSQQSLVLK